MWRCRRQNENLLMKLAKILLGLGLVAGAWAQPEPVMVISGRVVNTATKAGVPKALVTLSLMGPRTQPAPPLERFTGPDGSYEFAGLPMGTYLIAAVRPHFTNLSFRPENMLKPGDHKGLELPLTPLSQMRVMVRDLKGKPVPQTRVEVMRIQAENGFLVEKRVNTSSTDDRGLIRFYDWTPGQYLVRVAGRHGETKLNSREEVVAGDTYVALEPEQRLVELAAGREEEVSFDVGLQPAQTVSGALVGLVGGEPVEMEVVDGQGVAVAVKAQVDPVRGSFRVEGLLPGDWMLRAVQVANQVKREGIARVAVKGRDVKGLELRMGPVQAVPVKIECPGKSAPPGMRMVDSPCNVNVTFASHRDRVSVPLVGLMAGQTVRVPQSGNYQIVVQSFDDQRYPATVTFAGRPVEAGKPVAVDATQAIPPLEIEMREGAATLEVSYGANPKNKAKQLLLVPEGLASEGVRMMFGGKGGFSGLPPGNYALYELFDSGAAYQDPAVIAKLKPIATLRLAAGEKKTLDLDEVK